MNINELIALSDKLDMAGETTKANIIDNMIHKMSLDLPEFAGGEPELPQQHPEQLSPPAQEEVVEDDAMKLRTLFEKFIGEPTMDLYDELSESLGKHVNQQEGVVAENANDIFDKLSNTADKLDEIGSIKEADMIDDFIQKYAEDEQDKLYDSKYHHSLQIREPKKDQERVDREGRKDHHVHTYQHTGATSLNTRYCPDHVGVSLGRVSENTYQCPLDGQVYNWETGWTDYDGNEHPGGSIAAQTPDSTGYAIPHRVFDHRSEIGRAHV